MRIILAAMTLLATGSIAHAGDVFNRPFGISMGQKIGALDHPKRNGAELAVRSVPQPHPLLSRYAVSATGAAGVCQVKGYAPITTDGNRKVNEVVRHLSEVFGEPRWLPGNRDPDCTGIWIWFQHDRAKGNVEMVTVHRYESAGKIGTMATFEFANHKECEPKPTPNPFK